MSSSRKVPLLDSVLSEPDTRQALEALIASGCDKWQLLAILGLIHDDFPGSDTPQTLTGMNRKRLKAVMGRIRSAADEIARINREKFGLFLLPGSELDYLRKLPDMLSTYAELVEGPVRGPLRVRYPSLNYYKFSLTRYVIESTAGPHDEEVAALIDAVLPKHKRVKDRKRGGTKTYDALAHKQWRLSYYQRTAEASGEGKK